MCVFAAVWKVSIFLGSNLIAGLDICQMFQDWRGGRCASENIIPSSTGAAKVRNCFSFDDSKRFVVGDPEYLQFFK